MWASKSASVNSRSVSRVLGRYKMLAAEIAEGLTAGDINFGLPILYADRYGENADPGTTDMTSAIQSALNVAELLGGGVVYLGEGAYAATTLAIPTNCELAGQGKGSTTLYQLVHAGDFIKLKDPATTTRARVSRMTLNGRKALQATPNYGVHFDNSAASSALIPEHVVYELRIEHFPGSGLRLGSFTKGSRAHGITVYHCDLYGLELDGADSKVWDCDVGQSGADGVRVEGTSYNLWGIKSWYSGRLVSGSAGFVFRNSHNCIATGLDSQENSGHGAVLWGQSGPLIGCMIEIKSDADNAAGANYGGVFMANVRGAIVHVRATKSFAGAIGQPFCGVNIAADCTECEVTVSTDNLLEAGLPATGEGVASNSVRVNGERAHFAELFDDFLGAALGGAWKGFAGTDNNAHAPAIQDGETNGVCRLVCGNDAAGTMAANGSELVSSRNWNPNAGGLMLEVKWKVSDPTDVALFFGFTDNANELEMPFTLSGSSLTSNASDACGVLFDSAADTVECHMVGVADDVDTVPVATGVAPPADDWELWRVFVTALGALRVFRQDRTTKLWAEVGAAMAAAVTPSVKLTPVVAAFSRGAALRNVDLEYVRVVKLGRRTAP